MYVMNWSLKDAITSTDAHLVICKNVSLLVFSLLSEKLKVLLRPDSLMIIVVESIPTTAYTFSVYTFSSQSYHQQEPYNLFANMSIKPGINGISENKLAKEQNSS